MNAQIYNKMQETEFFSSPALGRMGRKKGEESVAIWVLVVCIWACYWNPSFVSGDTDPNDGEWLQTFASALNVLFTSLDSASQLVSWKQNGGDPCGESWLGIVCSGSSVTAIKLSGFGLSGTLGYNMNQLASLVELDMSNNNLGSGDMIPYNLPPNLHRLDLSNNAFGGSLPYSISQMVNLEYLNLSHNQLQGSLNDIFRSLSNLTTLDLSFDSFNGVLPQSFRNLTSLTSLYLQNNQFVGPIDILANLPLQNLNVANNHFNGSIPDQLKGINDLKTENNEWTSGAASPTPGQKVNPGQPSGGGGGGRSGVGGGAIAGIIISILITSGIIALMVIWRKSRKHETEKSLDRQDQPFAHLVSGEAKVAEMKMTRASSTIFDIEKLPLPSPMSLKPPPFDHYRSLDEDDFSNKSITEKLDQLTVVSTIFTVSELQIATDSFSGENFVGEGSLGRVFKAHFSDGKVLAVKKLNLNALPSRSADEFIRLVANISRLHHPNLTALVGYCSEHGQRMLVFDFHKNGSLHHLLQVSHEPPLSWNSRVKIALGAARALEYLHEVCLPPVVHGNFKSTNILLDMELSPHLSDYGLGSLASNAEYQGSEVNKLGFNELEDDNSNDYTTKSDVYNLGVVMLELMTGRKPFDSAKPRSEQWLVRWATPQLHDIDALERMVDPCIKGSYTPKSLSRFADVIALCIQPEPEFRPPMSEVVQALVRLAERANMTTRIVEFDSQEMSRHGDDYDEYLL